MNKGVYSKFESKDLILRDELAIDRTLLANERTLMAYLRAGVALIIAGATIVHFSAEGWFRWAGMLCIPLGIITAAIGVVRYRRMNNAITGVRNMAGTAAGQTDGNPKP